jgi:hypothetical protein
MEKRGHTRHYGRGSVVCSHFNFAKHYDGQVLNYSPTGMCFRSEGFFKPGTSVLIRLKRCPAGRAVRQEEGGLRTTTLARVQWCRHEEDALENGYTSGVRYI